MLGGRVANASEPIEEGSVGGVVGSVGGVVGSVGGVVLETAGREVTVHGYHQVAQGVTLGVATRQ